MMKFRSPLVLALASGAFFAAPAQAQLFFQSPDFRGAPVVPGEVGIGVSLPGATPAEETAAMAWQMRSGLNVMALQCQFDRTLLAQDSYNGILTNHRDELAKIYKTLNGYFTRTGKTKKESQDALDRYGTKTYTGFSTVRAQFGFCQTASQIAKAALFTPRGSFSTMASERLRELRNSLVAQGEQQFRFAPPYLQLGYPDFSNRCWKGNRGYDQRCGTIPG